MEADSPAATEAAAPPAESAPAPAEAAPEPVTPPAPASPAAPSTPPAPATPPAPTTPAPTTPPVSATPVELAAETPAEAPAPPTQEPTPPADSGATDTAQKTKSDAGAADVVKKQRSDTRQSRQSYAQDARKSKIDMSKIRHSTRDFRTWSRLGYVSMMSIKRGSFASFQDRQKVPKYMNSYKLNSEKPFNPDKVKSILVQVLTEAIEDKMTYDQEQCPTKAKQISSTIRQKVKEQDYDRYKLVCIVTIGEKKSYDILTGVRFLWDAERDRFATHFHENMFIFAVATVFGVYYE